MSRWRAIADAPASVKILYGKVMAMYWDVKDREARLDEKGTDE